MNDIMERKPMSIIFEESIKIYEEIYNKAFDDAIETIHEYFKSAIDHEYKYQIHEDIDKRVDDLLETNKSICNCLENKRNIRSRFVAYNIAIEERNKKY